MMAPHKTQPALTLEILRRGHSSPAPSWIPLRCGLLEMEFDPAAGWIRRLRVGEWELIRAIYGAVRDGNWATVPPHVHDVSIQQTGNGFRLRFEAKCVAPGIVFCWRAEIIGDVSGGVAFRFAGEAGSGFWKNRIGLCVLHPIEECAGRPCCVEMCDGTVLETAFPRLVSPHQPFKNVRTITHEIAPAGRVAVRFEGEVFETEDQRNWTDASFKTYSTPLDKPFPAWIDPGFRVEQSVTVRLVPGGGNIASLRSPVHHPEIFLGEEEARPLPPIGFGMSFGNGTLTARDAARLRHLRPAHLRVDLHLSNNAWLTRWRAASAEAGAIGTALHAAIFLSDDAERELLALAEELSRSASPVALWLIFHQSEPSTNRRWVEMAAAALPAGAAIAAGTDANFAELNRGRPDTTATTMPCFAINPQCHAFDEASLVENLAAQAAAVATTWEFAKRPVVISSITLRPRPSGAARTLDPWPADTLPQDVDVRQMSLFGAAWTVGSVARLAALDAVHSLTYYETIGMRGVMEGENSVGVPELFPSTGGAVYPMYHVFAWLAEGTGIVPTRSSHPLRCDGFCIIGRDGRRRFVVANLTPLPQSMRVHVGGSRVSAQVLDETNAARAMRDTSDFGATPTCEAGSGCLTLELKAYALAHIIVENR